MAKFFRKKSYGRRPRSKPKRQSLRNNRKRPANNKGLRKARKRLRPLSTHIARDGVKEDIIVNKKRMAKMPRNTSANVYQVTPTGAQISTNSTAQAHQVFYSGTKAQLNAALATTGQQHTTGVGAVVNTTNIFWRTYRQEYMFTNSTNATCILKLIHYDCRDDSATSLTSQWLKGMQDEQGSMVDNTSIYGCEPEMSRCVNLFWKRKWFKEYTLAPGATLKHIWVNKLNKKINNEMLNDTDVYMRGTTQAMMVIVRGTAATDNTSANLVDSTPVKMDVFYTQTVTYTYVSDADMNLMFQNGTGTGAVGAAVKVMNVLGVDPTYNATTANGY